jgi:hypothetical protein
MIKNKLIEVGFLKATEPVIIDKAKIKNTIEETKSATSIEDELPQK